MSLIGLALAFAGADAEYFDPRPAVVRAVAAGRFDPVLIRVANARYDVREMAADARAFLVLSLRENALTVAALLALLTITPGDAR
ncbi:hypothetical protein ACKI10_17625 [Streptomyces galilaeus]|uniref:Uncharacterized protein n=1 Tax=Streptomyces galilaeus TaxID=33899 RepID=A0ABW9IRW6_STRGJ